uniref:Uncharacterized protein n=1 Tax=Glossina austeni TaxID=7395 RepID=A0A1A9VTN9_GLOAU
MFNEAQEFCIFGAYVARSAGIDNCFFGNFTYLGIRFVSNYEAKHLEKGRIFQLPNATTSINLTRTSELSASSRRLWVREHKGEMRDKEGKLERERKRQRESRLREESEYLKEDEVTPMAMTPSVLYPM